MYRVRTCVAQWQRTGFVARPVGTVLNFAAVALAAAALGGCASVGGPERLSPVSQEMDSIRTTLKETSLDFANMSGREARRARNEFIAARKYAIDVQYTEYEAALTRESQIIDMTTKVANTALSQTALLVPVSQTKNLLNGIGTGVNTLDTAYDERVLRGKLIENVQASMRTARHERAAVIYANLRCSVKTYPMAMALSDLEAYYRAGTFTAGVLKLSQTVGEKEVKTAAEADSEKPGSAASQAKLVGDAAEANAKVNALTTTTVVETVTGADGKPKKQTRVRHAHRCTTPTSDDND